MSIKNVLIKESGGDKYHPYSFHTKWDSIWYTKMQLLASTLNEKEEKRKKLKNQSRNGKGYVQSRYIISDYPNDVSQRAAGGTSIASPQMTSPVFRCGVHTPPTATVPRCSHP